MPISITCNCKLNFTDFHDKKRRINYYKIKVNLCIYTQYTTVTIPLEEIINIGYYV